MEGTPEALDSIECTLSEKIAQGLGTLKRSGIQPWFRHITHDGLHRLKILAGLLPWLQPEREWPKVLDRCIDSQLEQLIKWGWRAYQAAAVSAALDAPLGRGIVEVGTGGGKTRIAWGIAYAAGGPWCYVVHGRDLVRQAATAFRGMGEQFGSPVNIQAMGWSDRRIRSAGWAGLIVDECHQASARTRAQQMAAFSGGWRIGLSGTPLDRSDDRNPMTVGFFGPVCYQARVSDLTEEGFLTPGRVVIVPFDPGAR